MLQMPDFVAMHRVLQNFYRRILINNESILNFTLIRYSMLRVYPLNWKQYRLVSEKTKQKLIPPTCKHD